MSHMPVGLDLEDLTPKQLRKALGHYARMSLPAAKRKKDGEEDEDDKEAEDNEDLVDLHREKGDSKPPKVTKDDMPEGLFQDDEEPVSKKKGKS